LLYGCIPSARQDESNRHSPICCFRYYFFLHWRKEELLCPREYRRRPEREDVWSPSLKHMPIHFLSSISTFSAGVRYGVYTSRKMPYVQKAVFILTRLIASSLIFFSQLLTSLLAGVVCCTLRVLVVKSDWLCAALSFGRRPRIDVHLETIQTKRLDSNLQNCLFLVSEKPQRVN